ncbi:Hypothetical protein D9617_27g045310 [Elsinoe fawcettii]|nr:Hypothetical protein D9617_27g045310 [Elsinoe fawcettii]
MFTTADVRHLIDLFPPSSAHSTSNKDPLSAIGPDTSRSTELVSSDAKALPTFISSASKPQLYPISVLKRKFTSHVATHGSVSTTHLSTLLDIADPAPLLQWADHNPSFSTPRWRKPDLPPWQQKVVAIWFFNLARRRPLHIDEATDFFGLEKGMVKAIILKFAKTFAGTSMRDWWVTEKLWEGTRRRLEVLRDQAVAEGRESERLQLQGWDAEVVNFLLADVLRGCRPGDCDLRSEGGAWWFIPLAALNRKQEGRLEEAVRDYGQKLNLQGWCIIAGSAEHQTTVLHRMKQTEMFANTIEVHCEGDDGGEHWPQNNSVLIKSSTLEATITKLLGLMPDVAHTSWKDTQDRDTTFGDRVRSLLRTAIDTTSQSQEDKTVCKLVLSSTTSSTTLKEAYLTQLSNFSAEASTMFLTALRAELQFPLHLYTSPLTLYAADQTLAEHQSSFLFEYVKSDILPTFFKSTATLDLPPPKDLAKELNKFKTAASEARNLDTLQSAFKKFARKVKLPDVHTPLSRAGGRSISCKTTSRTTSRTVSRSQSTALPTSATPVPGTSSPGSPDAPTEPASSPPTSSAPDSTSDSGQDLLFARSILIAQNLKTLSKAKRASDVLQQATWILLSSITTEPMVFISGGKDAGRMIKLFSKLAAGVEGDGGHDGIDWIAAGRDLEVFRGRVKEGKETGEEVNAIKALAEKGWEKRQVG